MCRLSGSSGTIKIKCKDLQVLHLDIPGMEQCLNIAHSIEVYQQTRFCSDFLRFIRLFTFTSLCPDPVRLGRCVGDVPFLLQTLWRQPAGPVGSLVPRKLLQPNEGTCKQLINYVYVQSTQTVPTLIRHPQGRKMPWKPNMRVKSQDILIA